MLNKIRTPITVFALGLALAMGAKAGNNLTDMNAFFNEIGGYGSAQGAQAFKGQTRNYYSGGSAKLVVPKKTYQLVTMTPPKFGHGGCGDIDIQLGAFSFINSDQFVAMLKDIGNKAKGAIFSLALESISPQLNAVQKYMKSLADRANQLNINSCEAVRGVISASPTQMAQKITEQAANKYTTVTSGMTDDWTAAKEMWNSPTTDHAKTVADAVSADNTSTIEDKNNHIGFNLLENALGRINDETGAKIPASDRKLVRALFGTVIYRQVEENGKTVLKPNGSKIQLVSPKDFVSELLSPTKTDFKTYKCEPYTYKGTTHPAWPLCLNVSEIPLEFNSVIKVITDKVIAIRNKVMNKSTVAFTGEEKALLALSPYPILSIIKQEYVVGDHNILGNSLDIIALTYIEALVDRASYMMNIAVNEATTSSAQNLATAAKDYLKRVRTISMELKKAIFEKRKEYEILQSSFEFLVQKVERARQKTAKKLSNARQAATDK